jgi:A/G-specific adenine glycosylase
LGWYDKNGRDLPWRKTRDPYRILVSEVMLQQTQVARVVSFYERWLKRFPDWKKLATAPPGDVLKYWSGLGYNRRALSLQKIAQHIVKEGEPKDAAAWLSLKGIGPYTAAAIALFSQHERTFPVDTVIRRVAGRLLLGKPFPKPSDDPRILARGLRYSLRVTRYWDVSQAFFDLGTAICKKVPDCTACPLRAECPSAKKFLSGRTRIPKRMIKKGRETIQTGKKYPDRIYRGRILRTLLKTKKSFSLKRLGPSIDPTFLPEQDDPWLQRVVERLERDQMITIRNQRVFLRTKH